MKRTKKLLAMIVAVMMLLSAGTVAFAKPIVQGDGNAYFFFNAGGVDVADFKSGFSVNGNAVNYITSDIMARTERIDKGQLIKNAVNTITIYTGNANGIVDESLSWEAGNKKCDEFGITPSTLSLILPDGTIVTPSKKIIYTPNDKTTPLKDGHNATEYTSSSQISMGDNDLSYAYKVDIQFDLSNITWEDTQEQIPVIKNVSLEIGAVPDKRNVVWYSTSQNAGTVQLALKSAMTGSDFPADCQTFTATAQDSGWSGYKSYKATVTGLAENQEYIYRVGNDTDGYSDIYSFKTQDFDGSFSFLAVSDPQLGQGSGYNANKDIQYEINGWTTTLSKAKNNFFNDVAFIACMGDQIANAEIDGQYDAFFEPEALKAFSLAVVPGNHDVGANYTPHYNMPNLSTLGVSASMGAGSGNYYFTYGDALFMTLNLMSSEHDEHIKFLEETVEAHPHAKWKFVMMHYAIYGSTAQGDTTTKIKAHKEALTPVFSRLGIDVVFQGHEHCYARSYMMNGATPNTSTGGNSVTQPNPNEVLYLTFNSASGSDYVTTESANLTHLAKRVQEQRPNFSKVDITDTTFTVISYFSDDENVVDADDIVDTFTITRDTTTPTVKSVHISEKNAVVKKGLTQQFNATALGYNNPSQEMNWSISGNESVNTTISNTGLLTVDSDETAESLVVTAMAKGDSAKYASVNVTLKSNITPVNAAPGETYTLPATVEDVAVNAWTDADGNTVTKADTSKIGYRYYKATLADGTTAKYRVNVGEYVAKHENLLAGFDVNCVESTKTDARQNKVESGGWISVAEADAPKIQVVNYDGLKTLKMGPAGSSASSFIAPEKAISGEYRLSAKMKLEGITVGSSDVGVSRWDVFDGTGSTVLLRVGAYISSKGFLVLKAINSENSSHNGNATTNIQIDEKGNTPWFDVSFRVYDNRTWSVSVNGTDILTDKGFFDDSRTVALYKFSPQDWIKDDTTVTYCADVKVDEVRYFTDALPKEVTTEIAQGAAAQQTATVSLTMSDGKTKDFTVNYKADTSKTGVQTVSGIIDGFDDTIPVTVTVKNIITGITSTDAIIEKATVQKVGNTASGVAVFAIYGSDHKFAAAKSVPFTESDFTDGVATLNVGLDFPVVAEGGYVKGFVFSNLTSIIPLDVVFTPAK